MKIMRAPYFALFATFVVSLAHAQGPLTPPGPPAPVMKTLHQVEPRIAITNLPWFIVQPGSYFITGDLVGGPGGIQVAASGVTIDLNGFTLTGGSGSGISSSGNRSNIVVRNGTLKGWSGNGLNVAGAQHVRLERLQLIDNGSWGAHAGHGAVIIECFAAGNSTGIEIGNYGEIRDCNIVSNQFTGLIGGLRALVLDSSIIGNGGMGANLANGARVSGCLVSGNAGAGILLGRRGRVAESTIRSNGMGIDAFSEVEVVDTILAENNGPGIRGSRANSIIRCTLYQNTGHGIEVDADSQVMGNLVNGSSLNGIHVIGANNRIEGNHLTGNNNIGLQVLGVDNLIVKNSAHNNFNGNYSIGPGNQDGPTGNMAAISSEPWGNFDY